MSISPLQQAISLLGAFLIGLAFGLLYDLIRPIRRRAAFLLEFSLDLLYWLVVTALILLCAPLLSQGYLSIFMLMTHGIGAFCYFKLLSRPIRWFTTLLDRVLCRLVSLALHPFQHIFSILSAQLSIFFHWMLKTAKKLFSFPLKWFRMLKVLNQSTSAAGQPSENEEGAQHDKNKTGWSCD